MAVDAAHARHVVPHPLGLQNVTDAHVIEPGLMAVPQSVQGQSDAYRQPGRERHRLGRTVRHARAQGAANLVTPNEPVETEPDRLATCGAPAAAILADQPGDTSARRRLIWLARHRGAVLRGGSGGRRGSRWLRRG